ncbi:hypothetical protein Bbelb_329250 [Branchiostoma belcheri]|nr:hypothetical protein Bbelb_329250 [Branchiostoma belcheri]
MGEIGTYSGGYHESLVDANPQAKANIREARHIQCGDENARGLVIQGGMSTDVLDRETRWWERGVKEAIYERMYNPILNREGGLRVDLSGTCNLALPAPRTDNT